MALRIALLRYNQARYAVTKHALERVANKRARTMCLSSPFSVRKNFSVNSQKNSVR